MKKRKSSKYFYSKKGDHHENLSSSQRHPSTTSAHSGSLGRKAQGFLISTLFMLFYELRIFIKEKIWMQKEE
ncbi:hypothetical protein LH656_00790 [Streptococcus sinensis]|nr:hypothetical protein [Streptococcus sinensis]MCF1283485.1 hypothetical protein [Streptococcus sinensis]